MKITGTIKEIQETQVFDSGFKKRALILVTEDKYPQTLSVEFLSDSVTELDSFGAGEIVEVSINLRGREWTSPSGEVKYFNSIVGWRIETLDKNSLPSKVKSEDFYNSNESDLPF